MSVKILFRRGTIAEWAGINPVLAEGEPGYEVETGKFKLGDGLTQWDGLPYADGFSAADTTYTVSAETAVGGAELRLTSINADIDGVNFIGGNNVTVTRTDNNNITIESSQTSELVQLTDVTITTPAAGDILKFDGATWLNTNLVGGTGINWDSVTDTISLDFTEFNTDNILEGTNLFYTDARFDTRFNASFNTSFDARLATRTTSDLSEGANFYYTQARFDASLGARTTDNLTEGTNLYYTNARFDSRFDIRLATKTTTDVSEGLNLYYTNARFDSSLATKTTSDVSEGLNLYYTPVRFDASLATKTTDNLTEGTNLYYTNARVDSRFDTRLATKTTSDVSEGLNLYYTNARFDASLATKTTDNLAEGANLYYTDSRSRNALTVIDAAGDGAVTYNPVTGILSINISATGEAAVLTGGTGIQIIAEAITLLDTAVTPGTYGSTTEVPQLTIDQQGRITSVSTVPTGQPKETLITTSTIQTVLTTFLTAEATSAKFVINAREGANVHVTELLCTHDDISAFSTNYAIITNNGILATYTTDVVGGTFRILCTPTTANSTTFTVSKLLV